MVIDPLSDAQIVDSWHKNAAPWTRAVRESGIESRRLATDRAIVDAVLARAPRRALDVGCGEGWLARALAARGVAMTGVDVVPEMVSQASASGGGSFHTVSYEDLAAGALAQRFDAVVCNFALLGKESVQALFASMPELLMPGGALIVQTLNPLVACGDQPYRDGWREGSWSGFDEPAFSDPAPWYFRTLESWVRLFVDAGLALRELREPVHPNTGRPASVILVGTVATGAD